MFRIGDVPRGERELLLIYLCIIQSVWSEKIKLRSVPNK